MIGCLVGTNTNTDTDPGRNRSRVVEKRRKNGEEGLDGFLDEAGPEASGADPNPKSRAVHHGTDRLEIGSEDALRFVVGMTDIVSGLMSFSAEITHIRHDPHSFLRQSTFVVCKPAPMLA